MGEVLRDPSLHLSPNQRCHVKVRKTDHHVLNLLSHPSHHHHHLLFTTTYHHVHSIAQRQHTAPLVLPMQIGCLHDSQMQHHHMCTGLGVNPLLRPDHPLLQQDV